MTNAMQEILMSDSLHEMFAETITPDVIYAVTKKNWKTDTGDSGGKKKRRAPNSPSIDADKEKKKAKTPHQFGNLTDKLLQGVYDKKPKLVQDALEMIANGLKKGEEKPENKVVVSKLEIWVKKARKKKQEQEQSSEEGKKRKDKQLSEEIINWAEYLTQKGPQTKCHYDSEDDNSEEEDNKDEKKDDNSDEEDNKDEKKDDNSDEEDKKDDDDTSDDDKKDDDDDTADDDTDDSDSEDDSEDDL